MIRIGLYFLFFVLIASCGERAADSEEQPAKAITPVTVTAASTSNMSEYIELNATSAFLQKSVVKASANGYLNTVNALVGKLLQPGQDLFMLKTKEAQTIGNTINTLDTTFKFSGIISIRASLRGYIAEVDRQSGDYVQEGEQLAVINDINSFVFVL